MKKHNYELLKSYLDKYWKQTTLIMFNCKREGEYITSWGKGENTTKKEEGFFILQNDLDSFFSSKNERRKMKKKDTKKDWNKQTEDIFKSAIKYGMTWQTKVYMRCVLEGCCYGNEFIDKEPKEYCIYCGEKNPQIMKDWMKRYIKPLKLNKIIGGENEK